MLKPIIIIAAGIVLAVILIGLAVGGSYHPATACSNGALHMGSYGWDSSAQKWVKC